MIEFYYEAIASHFRVFWDNENIRFVICESELEPQ